MKFTAQERQQKIESYANAYQLLTNALQAFPKEMWQFKPNEKSWSIHEIIIHITDSEANSYIRCRRLIAQSGSQVLGYDQDAWANKMEYHQQSTDEYLELFRLLRKLSYGIIKNQPQSVYETATIHHSENGWMTFDAWLNSYENHIPQHIAQMQRVYSAWTDFKQKDVR